MKPDDVKHKTDIKLMVAGAIALGSISFAQTEPVAQHRPNIVVILTDDLGYGDVRANNPEAKTQTPHLDRLADRGMRFTDGHASASVCSPSRYGLLTGRYAWRTSLKKGVLGSGAPLLIEDNCDTLASMLKRNGYRTAVVGKWHLGLGGRQNLNSKFSSAPAGLMPGPNQRGFDYSYIIPASLNMGPYVYLENLRPVNGVDGTLCPDFSQWKHSPGNGGYPSPRGFDAGYVAPGFAPRYDEHPDETPCFNRVVPHLTDQAAEWVLCQSSSASPFFLYFALPSPHTPWVPDIDTTGLSDEQLYMAYVRETDAAVGRIMDALQKTGQMNNTLIVFSSDNGPELRRFDKAQAGYSPSGIYRGMKSDLYEAGHRVPLFVSWPNRIPAGRTTDQLMCLTDLYRTISSLVADQCPDGMIGGEDSVDFSRLFLGLQVDYPIRKNLVYHSGHGRFGIREGDWTFLDWAGSGGYISPDSNPDGTPGQLFNLQQDPAEQHNLYTSNPERIADMKEVLDKIKRNDALPSVAQSDSAFKKIAFENTDRNQDGMIVRDEFLARHRSVNPNAGEVLVVKWFNNKDRNHDGSLTKEEFLSDRPGHRLPAAGEQKTETSFLRQVFEEGSSAAIAAATASSGNPAAAVDRNLATCWTADTNDAAWISVQLKSLQKVSSLFMSWSGGVPSALDVQVSSDDGHWKTVGSCTNIFPGMPVFVPCDSDAETRHVRICCLDRYKGSWSGADRYMLRELAVNPVLTPFMAEYKKPVKHHRPDSAACRRAESVLADMSLEQKLGYLGGDRYMYTQGFPDINLPALRMSDASSGLHAPPNTAFPASVLLASTWNPELAALQGKTIAQEARHNGIHILLGPGVNIYRDARNGRNFEYMGEDPFLAGQMAVEYIRAVQNEGVIATVKHLIANNIEIRRKKNNSIVSERTLREIYFPAFKAAVQQGEVKAVMTAYNLLNGTYCAEDPWLIKEILEKEWGFNGIVMSDWVSTYDPVACFNSGLDLEMPCAQALNPPLIRALLDAGVILEDELNDKVETVLYTGFSAGAFDRLHGDSSFPCGTDEQAERAEKIAEEGIVLLKNRDDLLPLVPEKIRNIILTGPMVKELPASGTGSGSPSYSRDAKRVGIRQAFESVVGAARLTVCETPEEFDALSPQDLAAADAVIACVGFNQKGWGKTVNEGEGHDRPFELTKEQDDLILRCAAVNPRTVVALTAGGGVGMSEWNDQVGAVLHTWYTGTVGGTPLAKIIFGEVNPSGRLPVSIERKWNDSPAAAAVVPTEQHFVNGWQLTDTPYDEGILVGYRWYSTKKIPVLYPFGFGLSYTTFSFSDLNVTVSGKEESLAVSVSVKLKNTGTRAGRETVQVYVHDRRSSFIRPVRELKGFSKVELAPGESRIVTIHLNDDSFKYFNPEKKKWVLESGKFEIEVGSSSEELPLKKMITL